MEGQWESNKIKNHTCENGIDLFCILVYAVERLESFQAWWRIKQGRKWTCLTLAFESLRKTEIKGSTLEHMQLAVLNANNEDKFTFLLDGGTAGKAVNALARPNENPPLE